MNFAIKGVKWERGNFPSNPIEVAERRPKVAHGETMGINAQTNKAPDGAKEISIGDFLPPLPGLGFHLATKPTVSPWATFCRASGAEAGRF